MNMAEVGEDQEQVHSAMSSMAHGETGSEADQQAQSNDKELENKVRLHKCYKFLVSHIEPNDVMDFMIQEKALTLDELDEIRNTETRTRKTRAEVLLGMVLRCQSATSMSSVLLEAFKSKGDPYSHVVNKILEVKVEAADLIKYAKRRRLSNLLELRIESAKKVFVETEAFNLMKSNLETNGYVMITGGPGSGKTTMALMLIDEYREKDHDVFYIDNLEKLDLDKVLDTKDPKLLVVDDVMGSISTTQDHVVSFNKHFNHLADLLQNTSNTPENTQDENRENIIKVIFTSKKWLLNESKDYLKPHLCCYFTESVVDLSSEMSKKELEGILSKHLENKGHHDCQHLVSQICINVLNKEQTALGFPYVCQLFSNDFKENKKHTVEFFKNTIKLIKTQLTSMFKTDITKKACFMLLLLCDGHLSLSSLTDSKSAARQTSGLDKKVEIIQKSINLPTYSVQNLCITIKAEAQTLKDTFFKIEDDNISFLHATIHDAVAFLLGEENIEFIISHCSMKLISERIRIKDETCNEGSELLITITEANHEMLARCLAEELCKKEFAVSLSHQAFGNMDIMRLIFNTLSKKKMLDLIHSHDTKNGGHFMFWVAYFSHPPLLTYILTLDNFCTEELLWVILATCVNGNGDYFDTVTKKDPTIKNQLSQKSLEGITKSNKDEELAANFQNYLKLILSSYLEIKGTCGLIHVAADFGKTDIVKKLLEAEVSVNSTTKRGVTPLMLACLYGHLDLVQMLLENGADNKCTSKDASLKTCLHYACYKSDNSSLIKILLQYHIDINCKDEKKLTPLCYASRYGNVEIVNLLVDEGADKHVNTSDGLNCLHLATLGGKVKMVQTFLGHGLDIESKSNKNETPLLLACIHGHIEIVEHLIENDAKIDAYDKDGRNALHLACKSGHLHIAKRLLKLKIDVNSKGEKNWTPLMYASRYGKVELVRYLLSVGADQKQTSDKGHNCLHFACSDGNKDIVKLLLSEGMDVNSTTCKGNTPLIYCCQEGNTSLVDILIEKGANKSAVDKENRNCLHYACMNNCHEEMLSKLIIKYQMDVNTKAEEGWTPMLYASRYNNLTVVQFLKNRRADETVLSPKGHNCLHLAACNGDCEMVEMFLDMKFDINSRSNTQKTPLMYATEFGNTDVAWLLISKEADVLATDTNGKNCYDWLQKDKLQKDKFKDFAQKLVEKCPELLNTTE